LPPDPQMRWLRLWTDITADPKIKMLAFEDRWHFVAILCMKRRGELDSETGELLHRMVGAALGLGDRERDEVQRRLMEVNLVDQNWQPKSWKKRQFSSDSSTHRVRAFRKRSGNVSETSPKRDGNGPESESESEQNQSRAEKDSPRDKNPSESKPARKSSRVPQDFSPDLAYASSQVPGIDAEREMQKFRDWEFKTPRSDWAAAWRQWIQRCKETGQYARKITASEWR
jgi:hypothetical protein